MNPRVSSPGLWHRASAVLSREGFGGVAKRVWVRSARASHLALESARWTMWKLAGRDWVTVNGYTMHIDRDDPGISRELALYRTHEPLATKTAAGFAASARTILDVGSNIGYYALLFLMRTPPPHVIAIEPSSRNLARLRRNLAANGLANATTVIRAAVSDYSGEGRLHLACESNWHTLLPREEQHRDSEIVPVVTLDALADELRLQSLDLIRMDIEGYESVAFGGMRAVLGRFRPRLIIELHPQLVGPTPIISLLRALREEHGYRVEYVIDREQDYAHLRHRARPLDLDTLLRYELSHRCFTVFMRPEPIP